MRRHLKETAVTSSELSFEDYRSNPYRPGFDGLRAVGFLMVVTAHIPAVTLFSYLQGWTAVWIFFVISGYLVTMLLIREERRNGRIAYGSFLIRRFFRIVPSYYVAVAIYFIACYALPPLADEFQAFVVRLPYYLLLMPEYAHTSEFTIFVHSWIIGIELKFYVFFPLVFFVTRNSVWRFALTALTTALLIAVGTFTANSYVALLFGVMLAQLLEWPRAYAVIATMTRVPLAVPLGFVVALFVMLRYTEQLTAVAAVATYLVAYVMLQRIAAFPRIQPAGLYRTAFVRRLPPPRALHPHRIHAVRQHDESGGASHLRLHSPRDHPGRRGALPRGGKAGRGFRQALRPAHGKAEKR
jgi:peptidoglycan/LPS O-acetylase OafA/YrhL